MALTRSWTILARHLDNESSTFDTVDEDEARFEVCVTRPRSKKFDLAASWKAVVFRIDVEEGGFVDGFACRIAEDGGDVKDADTGAVAGLIIEAVDYISVKASVIFSTSNCYMVHRLVVIDTTMP